MASATATKSPGKSTTKSAPTKKAPSLHPSYHDMVIEAVKASTDTKGASVPAIRNYITEKYKSVDPNTIRYRLKTALARCIEKEDLVKAKSKNSEDRPLMSSRFRINRNKKEKAPKKTPNSTEKKVTPKTTAQKKAKESVKGTKKKTATKKTPVKKATKASKPKAEKSPAAKKKVAKPKAPKTPKSSAKTKKAKRTSSV